MDRFARICLRLAAMQEKRQDVIRQAYSLWLFADQLKRVAFLPSSRKTQRVHRLRQVKKTCAKAPAIEDLLGYITRVERPTFFPLDDWEYFRIKRDRLTNLFEFLKSINTDSDIDRLKSIF
jgi:hypothetical protein